MVSFVTNIFLLNSNTLFFRKIGLKRGSSTDPLSFYVLMDTNNPFNFALSGNLGAIKAVKNHLVVDFLLDSNVTNRFDFYFLSKTKRVVSGISGECIFGK